MSKKHDSTAGKALTNATGPLSLPITRRSLLRAAGVAGLGPLQIRQTVSQEKHSTEAKRNSVTWTARNRAFNEVAPFTDMKSGAVANNSVTELRYLGARWQPYGNPEQTKGTQEHNGCWQHSFLLLSHGIAMKPWYFNTSLDDGDTTPELGSNPNYGLALKDFKSGFNQIDDVIPTRGAGWEKNDGSAGRLESQLEVSTQSKYAAVSVRRDQDLYGFLDGHAIRNALTDYDGVKTLTSLAYDPTAKAFSRIKREPYDRIEAIRRRRKERKEISSVVKEIFGLSLGLVAEASIGAVATTSLSGVTIGAGVAGLTMAVIELFFDEDDLPAINYTDGISQKQPSPQDVVTGCFAVFDVYTSPDNPTTFTVRTDHSGYAIAEVNGQRVTVNDSKSLSFGERAVWQVEIPGRPPEPDLSIEQKHCARLVPPNEISSDPSNHDVKIEDPEHKVSNRPSVDFGISPQRPVVGEPVRFDANNTILGGAPIQEYEWRFYRGEEEIVNPNSHTKYRKLDFTRMQVSNAGKVTGSIFDAPERGTFTHTFSTPGWYRVELQVWDENSRTQTVAKPLPVKGNIPEPTVSASIDRITDQTISDEPVKFEASATASGVSGHHPLPIVPDGNSNTERGRFVYEYGVVRTDVPFILDYERTPNFEVAESPFDSTYSRTFESAGRYKVYVRVTDIRTGATDTASTIVNVSKRTLDNVSVSLNTGYTSVADAVYPTGDPDDDWRLVYEEGANTGELPRSATVVKPASDWGFPYQDTRWISVNQKRGSNVSGSARYGYQTSFHLQQSEVEGATLRLQLRAREQIDGVFLNSWSIPYAESRTGSDGKPAVYSDSEKFRAGRNTLTVMVEDDGGQTGVNVDAGVSIPSVGQVVDDFEDDEYQSGWEALRNPDGDAVSVVNRESPAGGSKALRIRTGDAESIVSVVGKPPRRGWEDPWMISGLFFAPTLPGTEDPENNTGVHEFSIGVNDGPEFILGDLEPDFPREGARIVGNNLEMVAFAGVNTRENTWYRYEFEFDGTDAYTGARWPANGSRDDGVTITTTGSPPKSPKRLRLKAFSGSGTNLVLDHAFVEWKRK